MTWPRRPSGRDHAGPREAGGPDQVVHGQANQPGHEHEQAPQGGGEAARSHTELADIRDGGGLGPRARGPLLVATAWQAGKAFGAQDLVNGGQTEPVPLRRQGIVDVVDRQVLLAQGDNQRPGGILLGLDLRPGSGLGEEVAAPMAEDMAQDPERARGVAEAPGGIGGRHPLRKVRAQGLVLPVPGLLGLEEEPGRFR